MQWWFNSDLMGFNGDLIGDLMGFNCDLIGDLMMI